MHPLCVTPPILKDVNDAPIELTKSLGKVTTTVDPRGIGFVFEKVTV